MIINTRREHVVTPECEALPPIYALVPLGLGTRLTSR